jgi:hypothetical protein
MRGFIFGDNLYPSCNTIGTFYGLLFRPTIIVKLEETYTRIEPGAQGFVHQDSAIMSFLQLTYKGKRSFVYHLQTLYPTVLKYLKIFIVSSYVSIFNKNELGKE